jgi:hypothetical protein
MDTITFITVKTRSEVVSALAALREEWSAVSDDESLVGVEGSIGLFLADVVEAIGLLPEERAEVLGAGLSKDLEVFMDIPVSVAG